MVVLKSFGHQLWHIRISGSDYIVGYKIKGSRRFSNTSLYWPMRNPQFSGQCFIALCSWPTWSFLCWSTAVSNPLLAIPMIEISKNKQLTRERQTQCNTESFSFEVWKLTSAPLTRFGLDGQSWIPPCFSRTPSVRSGEKAQQTDSETSCERFFRGLFTVVIPSFSDLSPWRQNLHDWRRFIRTACCVAAKWNTKTAALKERIIAVFSGIEYRDW